MVVSSGLSFDAACRPLPRVERGAVVRLGGRLHLVLAFDPTTTGPRAACLEDLETGAFRTATVDELAAPAPSAATDAAA
jgi:hypothetical protein